MLVVSCSLVRFHNDSNNQELRWFSSSVLASVNIKKDCGLNQAKDMKEKGKNTHCYFHLRSLVMVFLIPAPHCAYIKLTVPFETMTATSQFQYALRHFPA